MTVATTLTAAMANMAIPLPPTIRPSTPSGASPFADLPHELMAEVFLHLDPHTLYTSIRFLNSNWKETVEKHIIPMLFLTEKWRVALRVHRRPRKDTVQGPMAEPEEARRIRVEATPGVYEDELNSPIPEDQEPPKIKQHIPLQFQQLDPINNRFLFSTGRDWYAVYEMTQKYITTGDLAFRLEVDFGLVWRFDGDGQEDLDSGNGTWGKLDQENGWLSKFYCSSYDLNNRKKPFTELDASAPRAILNTTQLARRRRLPAGPPAQAGLQAPLYWDDKHVEYLHLELTLGTEFFVRRSARANLLMRALELEAARREPFDGSVSIEDVENDSSPASPPSLGSKSPLHRPTAVKSPAGGLSPISHLKPGTNGHAKTRDGLSTPPRSALNSQLSPNMSPAEQLQMMARSKAAAKAAARRHGTPSSRPPSRPSSRAPSQPSSLAPSRVTSRAPSRAASRAPSRGPTRPGSPVEDSPAPLSMIPSPNHPDTPVASPRDLPFFRASALALSTNSPYTREALSGYITPDPNASLGLNRPRVPASAGMGPFGLPANAFSLRGGGGAQPGGTPIAEFKGRLRRAGGFDPLDLQAIARQEANGHGGSNGSNGSEERDEQEDVTEATGPSVWRKGPDIRDAQPREFRAARLVEPEEGSYQGDLETLWAWSR